MAETFRFCHTFIMSFTIYISTRVPKPFSTAKSIAIFPVTISNRAKPVASKIVISSSDILPCFLPDNTSPNSPVTDSSAITVSYTHLDVYKRQSIYKELGSNVILLASRILKDSDKEIGKRLTPMLKKQGIETYVDIRAKEITREGHKLKVLARYKEKDEEIEVWGDYVLIASGRGPVTEGLNLEGVGIETSQKGILVNDDFETTVPGIYAIGDVNSKGIQLAHVASAQGEYVVEKIMGHKPDIVLYHFPSCVFTMNEVAQAGFTEDQLKEKGIEYKVSKFMFSANGKALSLGEPEGIVKILAGKDDDKILGIHILGPHANDLIHEGALAIANQLDAAAITRTIHAHPTLSEAVHEAALGLNDGAIHITPKRKRN